MLLLPLGLLRLPELTPEVPGRTVAAGSGSADVLPLVLNSPLAHTVAFLASGLTLSFFVVALKNYLQSPIDR